MTGTPKFARLPGFTLIELMVVIFILALLGGIVGPQVMKHLGKAKSETARLQIKDLSASLDLYALDVGHYPTTEQGLEALVTEPPGVEDWSGPYLKKRKVPDDPWGYPYHYRSPGEYGEFDLYSLGKDNAEGGEKENRDILGWE